MSTAETKSLMIAHKIGIRLHNNQIPVSRPGGPKKTATAAKSTKYDDYVKSIIHVQTSHFESMPVDKLLYNGNSRNVNVLAFE